MNRPIAFEEAECTLPLSKIVPQHPVSPELKGTAKYKLISNSIKAIGLIEALVVYPKDPEEYLLLDGHSRLQVLKDLGATEVRCTLSTDDEAYTYNRKVNAISDIGQHFMIRKALENGVPAKRLAEALGLSLTSFRTRRDLLKGICPEAIQLLRNKKVAIEAFAALRKMKPVRQVEAAEHMIAGATYTAVFARALLDVTKPELRAKPLRKPKTAAGNIEAQEVLGKETTMLVRDLKAVEESYGKDVLSLTVCCGYIRQLIVNPAIESYLARNHAGLLAAIQESIAA